MARRTLEDDELLERALVLFRNCGYEGASLSRLASVTGLEKASLYYRFPGGKEEIAAASVRHALQWMESNVFKPLKGNESLRKRVTRSGDALKQLYGEGALACIMDVLSIPGATDEMKALLKAGVQSWIKSFAEVARESGMTPTLARARAEEAVTGIEGGLVLSRVLGDTSYFLREIKMLPQRLTEA